jgi:histidinol-phosphatase
VADADLDFALELAELADSLSLPRFRAADLRVETKPDLSPVTDADRAVERALRERIAAERPDESVFGEEEGGSGGTVRWIVDPIDGTRNFTRGLSVWATLIALERDGVVVCGVVSAPALGHRWWAARDAGAWRNDERIHVSRVASLEDAAVSCTHADDFAAFEQRVWHARGLGDFWQHVLVAEGALDAAVDARLALWDYAAVAIVVEEAGGRAGAPDGGPMRADEQLVSTNGVVHDAVLELLRRS